MEWGRGVEGEAIQQEWSGGGERGRRDTTGVLGGGDLEGEEIQHELGEGT